MRKCSHTTIPVARNRNLPPGRRYAIELTSEDLVSLASIFREKRVTFLIMLLTVNIFLAAVGASSATVLEQVDVFTQHTPAAWGTNYYCHRIPSAIQTPDGAVHIFAESRIAPAGYNGSCAKLDDEPPGRDDVTMRKSTDSGAQGPFPASPRFRLPAACRP
jgi:hypothetical protein